MYLGNFYYGGEMRKILFVIISGLILLGGHVESEAKIITFSDLSGDTPAMGEIPAGYEGFSWSTSTYWQNNYDQNFLDQYGISTGFMGTTAWSNNNISFIDIDQNFDFNSAVIAARYGAYDVIVRGYSSDGTIKYEDTVTVSMEQHAYYFDFEDIYKVEAISTGAPILYAPNGAFIGAGSHFIMDNIDVSDLSVAPEPISSTLFLIGGATLGFRRMRKKITN